MSISTDELRALLESVGVIVKGLKYPLLKESLIELIIDEAYERGLISDTDKPEAKVDKPKIDKVCSTCGTYKVDNDCVDCYHYSRWTYVGQRIAELSAENQKLRDMWEKLKQINRYATNKILTDEVIKTINDIILDIEHDYLISGSII